MAAQIIVTTSAIGTGGAVTQLRFNRPDKKNAITRAMYETLAEALDRAAADDKVRVVTILGGPDAFSAGNDIGDFLGAPPLDIDQPVFRSLRSIARFPKPLVAGVAGMAVGVGTTLLLHCDLVVASPNAAFSLPFVDLALVPEAASSLLLPRLIGHQRSARHLILGDPIDCETALAYGLVTEIVAQGDGADALERRVAEIALRISAKPPEAVRMTKALLKAEDESVDARIAREAHAFAARLASLEAREAFQAFVEKRPADFSA